MSRLYCAPAEFLAHPTGLDVQNLIVGGTPGENAAELSMLIQLASSFIDRYCYQPLYAHAVTETEGDARAGPGGRLQVRLRSFPCTLITAAQWKLTTAGGWTAIPVANTQVVGALRQQYWADDQDYRALQGWGLPPYTVTTQFVAGYPNPVLTAAAAAGATSITVDDVTGLSGSTTQGTLTVPGAELVVYDQSEQGGVESVAVQSVSGQVATLTSALLHPHAAGVRCSALPADVTLAAITLTASLIKERRAGGSLEMGPTGGIQPQDLMAKEDWQFIERQLAPFRRVV